MARLLAIPAPCISDGYEGLVVAEHSAGPAEQRSLYRGCPARRISNPGITSNDSYTNITSNISNNGSSSLGWDINNTGNRCSASTYTQLHAMRGRTARH